MKAVKKLVAGLGLTVALGLGATSAQASAEGCGTYKTVDSSGQTRTLNFSNDGIVTGLPNFKKYYVLTDFVAGPKNNLDEICFDIQTNNQRFLEFVYNFL